MKTCLIFILLFLSVYDACAAQWQIKKSVYRGETPLVGDMFRVNIKESISKKDQQQLNKLLATPIVVSSQRQWLNAQSVLKHSGIDEVLVTGQLWFDLCQTLDFPLLKSKVELAINEQIPKEFIRLKSLTMAKKNKNSLCVSDKGVIANINLEINDRLSRVLMSEVVFTNGQSISLSWLTEYEAKSMIATRRIAPSSRITKDERVVQWHRINNIAISQLLLDTDKDLLTKKRIAIGDSLNTSNVRYYPLVHVGERVKVKLSGNNWLLESNAKALASGERGEKIKILVENATAPIVALVLKEGEVSAIY